MALEINNIPTIHQNSQKTYLAAIPVIDASITYNDFFKNFLINNQCCIIKNIATKWHSTQFWVEQDAPNFSYLETNYKDCNITIYDCRVKYYNSQETSTCKFNEFIKYWKNYDKNGNLEEAPLKYLKDWHLKNEYPDDQFYEVPLIFASDWLNEYLVENLQDDYRFVYMGPEGSWTPFHSDVFTSYSWSTNICGQKKWLLFPPGEENGLKDSFGQLPYDLTTKPNTYHKCFEIIQNPGDAIFVPSGWYHQVWNLKNTISINHNWINGCNIMTMWLSLENALKDVKKEIDDCNDMENFIEQAQLVLGASFGLDFIKFYNFLNYIAIKRLKFIEKNIPVVVLNDRTLGKNHAIFDLQCIGAVLQLFVKHEDISVLKEFQNVSIQPTNLLNRVILIACKHTNT